MPKGALALAYVLPGKNFRKEEKGAFSLPAPVPRLHYVPGIVCFEIITNWSCFLSQALADLSLPAWLQDIVVAVEIFPPRSSDALFPGSCRIRIAPKFGSSMIALLRFHCVPG